MSPTPPESPSGVRLEHSAFLGVTLGAIGYGIYVALYFFTTYKMIKNWKWGFRTMCYLVYSFLFFVVTTVWIAALIRWNMRTLIDNRNYPGGPLAYSLLEVTELVIVSCTYIISTFLTDALMIYRCYIIWQGRLVVLALPFLMFLASTAFSIAMTYENSRPNGKFWSKKTSNFALPYWALTILMNILVTCLISGRLFALRKTVRKAIGEDHAKKYNTAMAMIIESAAPYTVTALILAITYAVKSYVQNYILALFAVIMPSTPLLIFLRLASGKGFTRELSEEVKTKSIEKMSFATGPSSTAHGDDSEPKTVSGCGSETPNNQSSNSLQVQVKNEQV